MISIIIPTRGDRPKPLVRLLESIYQSDYKDFEVLIINDGGPLIEQSIHSYSGLTIFSNKKQRGLAFSRSRGTELAKGHYLLFIDDDNVIAKNMIDLLINTLDTYSQIAAIGPHTYYYTDKQKQWFLGVKVNLATSRHKFFSIPIQERLLTPQLFITDNLHNCFMVRKEIGKQLNWFDEKVFLAGTELDLIQKIKIAHPDALCVTHLEAKCWHDVPLLSGHNLRSLGFENGTRVYYFQRNRGLITGRYGTYLDKLILFFIFYPFFVLAYSSLFIFHRHWEFLYAHLKGTLAGYFYLIKNFHKKQK